MTPYGEHALFLLECFFDSFHLVCNGWQNHVKLGKSTTETPEMLHEPIGEHALSWTVVYEWHSLF
jgi:hypothetical protein